MQTLKPFLVSYAVTRECNLKCKHCYSDALEGRAADELSTEEAKRVLDEVAGWGVKLLILDGGEPLCRKDFFDLISYASSKGLRVVIGSNGTLIDYETAIKLRKSGVQAVAISIDGAQRETHDQFRGVEGSFNKAMEGVKACREAGLPFQFNVVIRRSVLKEISDIIQMAVNAGANAIEFFDLVAVKRVKERCPEELLSVDERMRVMEWLAEAQRDCPIIIRVPACPMYPLLLKSKNIQPTKFPESLIYRIPYYEKGCAAGIPNGYLTILPNGDVIPCMLLQIKVGNVRERSLRELWCEAPLFARLRNRSLLQGACGNCEHKSVCAGCRGRAYEEKGDVLAEDPGCWIKKV